MSIMKKKIIAGKKLALNKEKLNQLNSEQLKHFLGGRMAFNTYYTSSDGNCSAGLSSCCSTSGTACC
jgi:hypothetical protein